METLLSGKSELPFGTFVLFMQSIHLAIGLVEGFVTVGIITYVQKARPEILQSSGDAKPLNAAISVKNILVVFVILAGIIGGSLLVCFNSSGWTGIEAGTSVSGIVGGGIILGFLLIIGFGIRFFKRK